MSKGNHTHVSRGPRRGYEWKTTRKAVLSPTIKDIAFAAGFCEGEASFLRSKLSKSQKVTLAQVNFEPLRWLQRRFGGNILCANRKRKRGNEQRCYRWEINGCRARGFMMTVFAFMSAKRKAQIFAALDG